jgi:argininosuccinate lyase
MSRYGKDPPWGGRFASSPAGSFQRLNASIPFDVRLAPHDIRGSIAHARMLGRQGIVSEKESGELVRGLEAVLEEVNSGKFTWSLGDEDVHTAVERRLREIVGDVALKLHTGRSRNDQVSLDIHLFCREVAGGVRDGVIATMRALLEVAEREKALILPGYTHLQRAQPILLSHHLLAHFEAFKRDVKRLEIAQEAANVSPLGAAALAGTPHPVDPQMVAGELGMQTFVNSLDAVSERDFALDLLYALAVLGVHLSRLGEEWVLWSSAEFGFVELDDRYSSGSSVMPQKKNPDAFELMRGKAGRLVGDLNSLLVTLKGIPTGYFKDLQEDKETLFDAVDSVALVLDVLPEMVRTARFNGERMSEFTGGFALATEIADFLAGEGVPFRVAHRVVGELVRRCEELGISLENMPEEELDAAHPTLAKMPRELLAAQGSVENKSSPGSTSPESVEEQLRSAREFLEEEEPHGK